MQETKRYSAENTLQDVPIIGATEAALWERLLDPASADLSPEAARYILNLRFPQQDTDRMHELAEKARAGTLSLEEHIEIDNYERVGHVLSLMKSKARAPLTLETVSPAADATRLIEEQRQRRIQIEPHLAREIGDGHEYDLLGS